MVAQHLGAMPQTNPLVKSAVFDGNTITIQTNAKGKNCMEALKEAVNACVSVCRANSMVNCCEFCGSHDDLGIYSLAGRCTSICSTCFGKAQTDLSIAQQEIKETKSNVAAGIVGALLGSLIGVVLWVIVYQLGYIAGIVGFVMAICCMKGYEKFGGKLNLPGMIISLVMQWECCILRKISPSRWKFTTSSRRNSILLSSTRFSPFRNLWRNRKFPVQCSPTLPPGICSCWWQAPPRLSQPIKMPT
ncbi:hypothetical protein [Caproiciproducens sp. LBM24188]